MLSVAKLARGREAYYLETVAPGREGRGVLAEPEGRWLGRAASTLGLVGAVDGAQLTALLAGVDPNTGEILSAYHHRVRVAAYDCTYSTPKSACSCPARTCVRTSCGPRACSTLTDFGVEYVQS